MIQRIQTLWLVLASLAAMASLKFSFFSGNRVDDNQAKTWTELTAVTNFLTLIITAGIGVCSLIVVFLYKNRKLQIQLTVVALILSLLNIFLLYRETQKYTEGNFTITSIITLLIPIFLALAIRGIYKDEKLIKSADRLR
jgi:amino acid transporter